MKRRRTRRRRARRRRTRGGGVLDFMLGGFVRKKGDPKIPPDQVEELQIKCMEATAANAKNQNRKVSQGELTARCGNPNIMWKPGILAQFNGEYPELIAAHFLK